MSRKPPDDAKADLPPRPRSPFDVLRGLVPDAPAAPAAPSSAPPPESARPAGSRARVTVRRERSGRGGKSVTVAEGPGLAGRDLGLLARQCAAALGLGARVEGEALVVQGDQCERLIAWLGTRGFDQVVRGN